jgi:hypothetical protein
MQNRTARNRLAFFGDESPIAAMHANWAIERLSADRFSYFLTIRRVGVRDATKGLSCQS